jgi:hypothetical protein
MIGNALILICKKTLEGKLNMQEVMFVSHKSIWDSIHESENVGGFNFGN